MEEKKVDEENDESTEITAKTTPAQQPLNAITDYLENLDKETQKTNKIKSKNVNPDKSAYGPTFFRKLDNSVKKISAFKKRIQLTENSNYMPLIEELDTLNLSRYLSEVVHEIFDDPNFILKQDFIFDLLTQLNIIYSGFSEELNQALTTKLKNIQISDASYVNFALLTIEICKIGIFDTKTSCVKVLSLFQQIFKSSHAISIEESTSIFNRIVQHQVYHLFAHHPRKFASKIDIACKEEDSEVNRIINKLSETPIFPPKFTSMMQKLVKEYHEKHLCPHVSDVSKKLAAIEKKCEKLTEKTGDVSQSVLDEYDQLFEQVNTLRGICLTFSNLTKLSIKEFHEDEELEDIRVVKVSEEDYEKMFATSQEFEFYCQLVEFEPDILKKRPSDPLSSLNAGPLSPESKGDSDERQLAPLALKQNFEKFLNKLGKCYNRDMLDTFTVEYLETHHSRLNLRTLHNFFQNLNQMKNELLPFIARFIANLNAHVPELSDGVANYLVSNFNRSVGQDKLGNIDLKLKLVRFISQLIKFDILQPVKILHMFRRTKKKLTSSDIQMVCCLFNSCGTYMFNHPASHHKTKLFLETLFRVKARIPTERNLCALIDEVYYHIFPADKKKVTTKSFTIVERFMQNLIWHALNENNIERTAEIILMTNLHDTEQFNFIISTLVSPWNIANKQMSLLVELIVSLTRQCPDILTCVIENLVEYIYAGLITNEDSQIFKRACCITFAIELYEYELVDDSFMFMLLQWHLLLGQDPINRNAYSMIDPPSSLFRLQCASLILHQCSQYLQNDEFNLFEMLIVYYQLYYFAKKENPIWHPDLFPINIDQMVKSALNECASYFKFSLYNNFEECSTAILEIISKNQQNRNKIGNPREFVRKERRHEKRNSDNMETALIPDHSDSPSSSGEEASKSQEETSGQEIEDEIDHEMLQLENDLQNMIEEEIKQNIREKARVVVINDIPNQLRVLKTPSNNSSGTPPHSSDGPKKLLITHRDDQKVATVIRR